MAASCGSSRVATPRDCSHTVGFWQAKASLQLLQYNMLLYLDR